MYRDYVLCVRNSSVVTYCENAFFSVANESPPQLTKNLRASYTINVSLRSRFSCTFSGNPQPSVTWTYINGGRSADAEGLKYTCKKPTRPATVVAYSLGKGSG